MNQTFQKVGERRNGHAPVVLIRMAGHYCFDALLVAKQCVFVPLHFPEQMVRSYFIVINEMSSQQVVDA